MSLLRLCVFPTFAILFLFDTGGSLVKRSELSVTQ